MPGAGDVGVGMTGDPYLTRDLDYLLGPALASRIPQQAKSIVGAAGKLLAALHYPGEGLPPIPHLLSGETENGPVSPGRLVHSGADLAAWLDDGRLIVDTGEGT